LTQRQIKEHEKQLISRKQQKDQMALVRQQQKDHMAKQERLKKTTTTSNRTIDGKI